VAVQDAMTWPLAHAKHGSPPRPRGRLLRAPQHRAHPPSPHPPPRTDGYGRRHQRKGRPDAGKFHRKRPAAGVRREPGGDATRAGRSDRGGGRGGRGPSTRLTAGASRPRPRLPLPAAACHSARAITSVTGRRRADHAVESRMLCRRHHRAGHEEGYQVEPTARWATELPAAGRPRRAHGPPHAAVPADPVEILRAQHDALGFRFTRGRRCRWLGERLDVGWAIDVLQSTFRPPRSPRIAAEPGTGAQPEASPSPEPGAVPRSPRRSSMRRLDRISDRCSPPRSPSSRKRFRRRLRRKSDFEGALARCARRCRARSRPRASPRGGQSSRARVGSSWGFARQHRPRRNSHPRGGAIADVETHRTRDELVAFEDCAGIRPCARRWPRAGELFGLDLGATGRRDTGQALPPEVDFPSGVAVESACATRGSRRGETPVRDAISLRQWDDLLGERGTAPGLGLGAGLGLSACPRLGGISRRATAGAKVDAARRSPSQRPIALQASRASPSRVNLKLERVVLRSQDLDGIGQALQHEAGPWARRGRPAAGSSARHRAVAPPVALFVDRAV